jgi:chromate transporter
VYFALHTLFADTTVIAGLGASLQVPVLGTVRWVSVAITAVAAVLLFRAKWSVLRTLGVCAALGLVAGLVGLTVT